jgi:hypothetical protein
MFRVRLTQVKHTSSRLHHFTPCQKAVEERQLREYFETIQSVWDCPETKYSTYAADHYVDLNGDCGVAQDVFGKREKVMQLLSEGHFVQTITPSTTLESLGTLSGRSRTLFVLREEVFSCTMDGNFIVELDPQGKILKHFVRTDECQHAMWLRMAIAMLR